MSTGAAKGHAEIYDRVEDVRMAPSARGVIFRTLRSAQHLSEARSPRQQERRNSQQVLGNMDTIAMGSSVDTTTLPHPHPHPHRLSFNQLNHRRSLTTVLTQVFGRLRSHAIFQH
eukprot:TRINITY_DN11425_c1_g1_i1.p3 TRINITY_DN11425_c1_g1~~TRINITY_DN11425_c1_g1_i1.p3  ORF type:complete len:115 (-),score=4.70 TRINITY_DN11425_c1_g1_i1:83-427(-)